MIAQPQGKIKRTTIYNFTEDLVYTSACQRMYPTSLRIDELKIYYSISIVLSQHSYFIISKGCSLA
jgi:hypothetical protein